MVKKSPENTLPAIVDNVKALTPSLRCRGPGAFCYVHPGAGGQDFLRRRHGRQPASSAAREDGGGGNRQGIVEDKVIKNHYASEYIYNHYKEQNLWCAGSRVLRHPQDRRADRCGGGRHPDDQPHPTAIFKTLISLKTRNGIIICPHPGAKKCTIAAAKLVLDAAVAAGAPEGMTGWIDVPSMELTNMVMRSVDIILATGGPGMVKGGVFSGQTRPGRWRG